MSARGRRCVFDEAAPFPTQRDGFSGVCVGGGGCYRRASVRGELGGGRLVVSVVLVGRCSIVVGRYSSMCMRLDSWV